MTPERPLGISIVTWWTGLFAGVFPLGAFLYFYYGPANGAALVGKLPLVLSVVLNLGMVFSAIGTRAGSKAARNCLIGFVLIHYSLVAYRNYQLASAGVEIRGDSMIPVWRFFRSIVTAIIISGYLLLSRKAQRFFEQ